MVKEGCFDLSARVVDNSYGEADDLAALIEACVLMANKHWGAMGKRGFVLFLELTGDIIRDGLQYSIHPATFREREREI